MAFCFFFFSLCSGIAVDIPTEGDRVLGGEGFRVRGLGKGGGGGGRPGAG